MVFYTKYKRPEKFFEINSGEVIVESAGVVPTRKRVEGMILAGMRLDAMRGELYDAVDERVVDSDIDVDPTRSPGYDIFDAVQDAKAVGAKLRMQEKANRKAKEEAEAVAEAGKVSSHEGKIDDEVDVSSS